MRLYADFGKLEGDLIFDYFEHVDLRPGHPLEPVWRALRDGFHKEIRRRRVKYKQHIPARSIDLPLEALSPESLLELQDRMTEITKKLWPLKMFHSAQLFQSTGLACHDLLREMSEQLSEQQTLH